MEFPFELKMAIEKQTNKLNINQMKEISGELSERYRNESGKGKKLLTRDDEAIVYSAVRMPATFGAVSKALEYALNTCDLDIKTLLDVGAGTGAGSWAANSLLRLEEVTCLERESAMRNLGQGLMKESPFLGNNAKWISTDIIEDSINYSADLVIASYVLNELSDEKRNEVLEKLWKATKKMLLIVEPGTPVGFNQLKKARTILLEKEAHIAAPCPHENMCALVGDDWCHFTSRVQRSKLHKMIKKADVPYEDEKYSYVAFTKSETNPVEARILRHPYIEKGKITLEICSSDGKENLIVKKKDGSLFKKAKKSKCGDGINR